MDERMKKFLSDLVMVTVMIVSIAGAGILTVGAIIWLIVRMVAWIS